MGVNEEKQEKEKPSVEAKSQVLKKAVSPEKKTEAAEKETVKEETPEVKPQAQAEETEAEPEAAEKETVKEETSEVKPQAQAEETEAEPEIKKEETKGNANQPKSTKPAKPTECASCGKALRKKLWYYRHDAFYCTKKCFKRTLEKKSSEEK